MRPEIDGETHLSEPERQIMRPPRRRNHFEHQDALRIERRRLEIEAEEERRLGGHDDPRAGYLRRLVER